MKKRTVKSPEVRRKEIIDTARSLFETGGYDNTPVERIIEEARIAKGTFYYYFKSKKELLGALVDDLAKEMESHFSSIADMDGLGAIEKLRLMFRGAEKEEKVKNSPEMELIHRPENRELQEELNIRGINVLAPIIARVVEQGNSEGVFRAERPLESVQILLAGSQFLLDSGLFSWAAEKESILLKRFQAIFEMVVGVDAGGLNPVFS